MSYLEASSAHKLTNSSSVYKALVEEIVIFFFSSKIAIEPVDRHTHGTYDSSHHADHQRNSTARGCERPKQ